MRNQSRRWVGADEGDRDGATPTAMTEEQRSRGI